MITKKKFYCALENTYNEEEKICVINKPIIYYIHIPKTGGSSVEQALILHNMYSPYNYNLLTGKQLCKSLRHEPVFNLNINFNNDICFVTVRKPFDRFISNVKWLNYVMTKQPKNIVKITSLEETLNELENVNKTRKNLFDTDCHYIEQIEYLYDIYGNKCTNIIRMENMQEDMNLFFKKYGLDPIEIKNINSTQNKKDIKLTREQKRIIYNFYKKDFDFFIKEGIYTAEELEIVNL